MKMIMNDDDKRKVISYLKDRRIKSRKELAEINWNFISAGKLLPDDWEDLGTRLLNFGTKDGMLSFITLRSTVDILGCGYDYDDYKCILDDPIPLS